MCQLEMPWVNVVTKHIAQDGVQRLVDELGARQRRLSPSDPGGGHVVLVFVGDFHDSAQPEAGPKVTHISQRPDHRLVDGAQAQARERDYGTGDENQAGQDQAEKVLGTQGNGEKEDAEDEPQRIHDGDSALSRHKVDASSHNCRFLILIDFLH